MVENETLRNIELKNCTSVNLSPEFENKIDKLQLHIKKLDVNFLNYLFKLYNFKTMKFYLEVHRKKIQKNGRVQRKIEMYSIECFTSIRHIYNEK